MLIRDPLWNQLGSLNPKGYGMKQGKKASSASIQHHPYDAPGGIAILFVLPFRSPLILRAPLGMTALTL
nr:hypothetical protein [Tanacetum cinerariifolium]